MKNNILKKKIFIFFFCFIFILFFHKNNVYAWNWIEEPLEYNYHNIWRMIEFIGHKPHNTIFNYYASEFMMTKNHIYTFESEAGWNNLIPLVDFAHAGVLPGLMCYMSLSEITFLLPSPKEMNIDYAQYLDLARLIQFTETSRYIEAFYENKPYDTSDIPVVYISTSPAYTCLYNENNELLAYLDKLNNNFVYQGKSIGQYNDFIYYIKKSFDSLIETFIPNLNYEVRDWESFSAESLTLSETFAAGMFSKKQLAKKKYKEMIKLGLNPNNKNQWNNYFFKMVKFSNPYFLKWRYTPFLIEKNSFKKPFKTDSLAKQHHLKKKKNLNLKDIQFLTSFMQDCYDFINEINLNHKKNADYISPVNKRNKLPLHTYKTFDEERSVPKFYSAYNFTGFKNAMTTWNYSTANKIGRGNMGKIKYRPKERPHLGEAWLGNHSDWYYYWALIDRYEHGVKKLLYKLLKTIPLDENNYKSINHFKEGDPRKILFNLFLKKKNNTLEPILLKKNLNNTFLTKDIKLNKKWSKEVEQFTEGKWEKKLFNKNLYKKELFDETLNIFNLESSFYNLQKNIFFNEKFFNSESRLLFLKSLFNSSNQRKLLFLLNNYLKENNNLANIINIKKNFLINKKKFFNEKKYLKKNKLNNFWSNSIISNIEDYKSKLYSEKYNFNSNNLPLKKEDFWHKKVNIDKPYQYYYKHKKIYDKSYYNKNLLINDRDLNIENLFDVLMNIHVNFIKEPMLWVNYYNTYGINEWWHYIILTWIVSDEEFKWENLNKLQEEKLKKKYSLTNYPNLLVSPFFTKNNNYLSTLSCIEDEEIKWLFFESFTEMVKDVISKKNVKDKFTWETKPKFLIEITDPEYIKPVLSLKEQREQLEVKKWLELKDIPFKEIHNLSEYLLKDLNSWVTPFKMGLLQDEKFTPTSQKTYQMKFDIIAEDFLKNFLSFFNIKNKYIKKKNSFVFNNSFNKKFSGYSLTEKFLDSRNHQWKLDTNSKDSQISSVLSDLMLLINNLKAMNNVFKEKQFNLKELDALRLEKLLIDLSNKQINNTYTEFSLKDQKNNKLKTNLYKSISKYINELKLMRSTLEREGYFFEKDYKIITQLRNKLHTLPSIKKLFLYSYTRFHHSMFGIGYSRHRMHNYRNHRITWLLVRNGRKRSKKNKWKGQIKAIIPLHRAPLPAYYRLTGIIFGKIKRGPITYKGHSPLHYLIDSVTLRDQRILSNYFFRYKKYLLKTGKKEWKVLRQKDGETAYTRWNALFESPAILTNHDKMDLFPLIDIFANNNIKNIRNLNASKENLSNFYFNDNLNWKQILKTWNREFYNNSILDFFFTKYHIIDKSWLTKLKYHYFIKVSKNLSNLDNNSTSSYSLKLKDKGIFDIKFDNLQNLVKYLKKKKTAYKFIKFYKKKQ